MPQLVAASPHAPKDCAFHLCPGDIPWLWIGFLVRAHRGGNRWMSLWHWSLSLSSPTPCHLPLSLVKILKYTCSFLCNIDQLAQDYKPIKLVELHDWTLKTRISSTETQIFLITLFIKTLILRQFKLSSKLKEFSITWVEYIHDIVNENKLCKLPNLQNLHKQQNSF